MTDTRQIEREDATNAYVTELRADNARLRAENQRLTLLVQSVVVASGGYIAEPRLERLQRQQKTEIERLRAALQEIADYDGPRSQRVEELARRALEGKPTD